MHSLCTGVSLSHCYFGDKKGEKVQNAFQRFVVLWDCSSVSHIQSKGRVMQHKDCAVGGCSPGPTDSQLIMSERKRQASLMPLAHLAAWWLLLICPQASVSTSPIWTRIKGPNTNSCAEISHVSIYSYFVNQCTAHAAQITSSYIWIIPWNCWNVICYWTTALGSF